MRFLLLLAATQIFCFNAQLSNTNSKCISNITTIWCSTIHSVTNINYRNILTSTVVYPNNIYPYFCNDYSGNSYYYEHYQTDQNAQSNNIITFPSSTHCFDGSIILGACINIASDGNPSLLIGQANLFNFKFWNINPSTISIPLDKTVMDQSIYNSNQLSRITITKYQSLSECIEILNGIFPFGANQYYYIEGYIFKSDNNNKMDTNSIELMSNEHNPQLLLKISTTSDDSRSNPRFNELFCFASLQSNDHKYIHIALDLYTLNNPNTIYKFEYIIIDITTYNQTSNYQIDLINYNNTNNAYINIKYWERCDSNYNTETANNNHIFHSDSISASDQIIYSSSLTLSRLSSTFLIVISIIGFIIIIIVTILSNKLYPSGDPINYFALVWMVLELWDFWSDISFTIYLYIISLYYPSPFLILFILSLTCVIIPYILNISYFKHITNLWGKQIHACKAPQIWLNNKCYYIYFLLISLITGGVFPAIELSNSVLIPYPLFTMRVPYFELVRVRTERFITNVLFENIPFLILQIGFYYAIKSLNSRILFSTVGGFVFLGTVLSSILSVLFSGTYYFSYKGKSALPIAVYKLQITIECTNDVTEIKKYWKYSVWRMQTAISKAFQVSSPTLIIIDNCDIIDHKIFHITCRLLYDEAPFGNQTNIKILLQNKNDHSVTGDLCRLFTKEFQLLKQNKKTQLPNNSNSSFWTINNSLRVSNCSIGRINGGEGELVYDYGNSLLKTICCYICKCGKRGVYRRSTKDVLALYKKKSESRYNKPNMNKEIKKSHIRNVSAMKAAFGKHHKISDAKPYKPKPLNSRISTSNISTTVPTHKRIESNVSNSSRMSKTYDKPLPVNSPSGSSHFAPMSPMSPSHNMSKVQTIEEEDEDEDIDDDDEEDGQHEYDQMYNTNRNDENEIV